MVRHIALLLPLSLSSPCSGAMEFLIADARHDAVFRMTDRDGSGAIDAEEIAVAYDDSAAGPDLSTPADLWVLGTSVYLLDGGTLDAILALADADGDGAYRTDGEAPIFFGPACKTVKFKTPNRLAHRDGVFVVADDTSTAPAVILLQDVDGDGAACLPEESLVFYEALAAGVAAPPKDLEALCVLPDHSILVGASETGTIHRLADVDGDGQAAGDAEVLLYYAPPPSDPLPRFSALAEYGAGMLACDRVHGAILYLEDRDGDGTIGAGEASPFCGAAPGAAFLAEPVDVWVDGERNVWIADNGTDSILFAADRNGDGDALDAGETLLVAPDAGVLSQPTGLVVLSGPAGSGPRVEGLSAASGSASGGDVVVVTGENFSRGCAVFFGDAPALEVEFVDAATIRATTPPGSGTVGVTVASVSGLSTLPDGWSYAVAALGVDNYAPAEGPAAGGFEVTFRGRGLERADVWFGGVAAEVLSRAPDRLVARAPAHEPGTVTILVANGLEEVSLSFTYGGGTTFTRGDVDGDGRIVINDAIRILSILFARFPKPPCHDRADVNDDGGINIADAINVLSYLFARGAPPRPPFAEPGVDPTPDGLECP